MKQKQMHGLVGIENKCKLFYTEWINNKALLHSTGNYTHMLQ